MANSLKTKSAIRESAAVYSSEYWDYFDEIYCISLKNRPDRRKEARAAFKKIGLAQRVEFVIVNAHPTDHECGIYESHMYCMEKGVQAGADTILIFEDDILFARFSLKTLRNSITFLSETPDWHILFLGCMVKNSRKTSYPSVLKISYRSLAHAYAVNGKFAEKLIRIPWRQIAYDDFLRDLADEAMYVVCPSFAFQSNSRSDNLRYLPLDRFRRICSGLQRLQKLNEFYQKNKKTIIAIHLIILAIIIILACFAL